MLPPRPGRRALVVLLAWLAGAVAGGGLLVGPLAGPAAADVGADVLAALQRGLRDDDPEARRRAVADVGRLKGHLDEAQLRRAALDIRKAFDGEADRETRRLMVRALARMGSATSWVPVILAALGDRDPEVRTAAHLEVLGGRQALLDVVARLLDEDEDPTFRARLLLLLGDRRRHDAVPLLIARLADPSPRVVAAAAEALEAITDQALGYDAALWARWRALWERAQEARVRSGAHRTVADDEGVPTALPPPHVSRGLVPSFFGMRLGAKDLVFVVDVSGSVGPGGIERVRRELLDTVERLGSDVHFAVLFFSEEVHLFKPELVLATPQAKGELAYFLRGIAPGRKTDVFTPLNAGLQLVRKRVEAKLAAGDPFRMPVTLVVVSDGRNNVDRTPPGVVADKLDRLDLERTVVHAIVLGGEPHPLMRELARRGGGHLLHVP